MGWDIALLNQIESTNDPAQLKKTISLAILDFKYGMAFKISIRELTVRIEISTEQKESG